MRRKTKKSATAVADMSVRVPLVQTQQSVDIMFLESVPSLIAVAAPFDLVLAVSLKTTDMDRPQRSAAAITAGLDNMVGTMAGQGFDVTEISFEQTWHRARHFRRRWSRTKNRAKDTDGQRTRQSIRQRTTTIQAYSSWCCAISSAHCITTQFSEIIRGDRGLPDRNLPSAG